MSDPVGPVCVWAMCILGSVVVVCECGETQPDGDLRLSLSLSQAEESIWVGWLRATLRDDNRVRGILVGERGRVKEGRQSKNNQEGMAHQ
jgi:hypothetical protein